MTSDLTKPFLELADRVETFCGENIETTKAIRTLVSMLEKCIEGFEGTVGAEFYESPLAKELKAIAEGK